MALEVGTCEHRSPPLPVLCNKVWTPGAKAVAAWTEPWRGWAWGSGLPRCGAEHPKAGQQPPKPARLQAVHPIPGCRVQDRSLWVVGFGCARCLLSWS